MKQYLLIDIGGTFIKYSLADEQARKISGGKVPTPLTNMDDLLAVIEGFAAPLQGQFVGCAISMPGRIETRTGIAHTGGMLSAFMWEQPFAAQVEARLGVPVTIANDGKCAAAAEGWTGALAGVENGLVLVLGTGIGGGIILNGKVLMGAHAAAGEVSCLVSNMAAMEAETFELDKVESFSDAPMWAGAASATGLIREYTRQKKLPLQGPLPTGEEIFAAYNAGEPEAQRTLKIFARRVATGNRQPAKRAGCGARCHWRRHQCGRGSAACHSDRAGQPVCTLPGASHAGAGAGALPLWQRCQHDRCPEAVL